MSTALDPGRRFETFVPGAANQLALSAARAFAEAATPPFNPLHVHGGPGLGKTHLLQALAHRRLEVDPRAVVRYVAWADLAEGWRAAHALGRGAEFLRPLGEADLLLLDDAHRLADSGPGREELLGLLDARVAARRPTVLASRRAPAVLVGPDDPAARLLAEGLTVELGRPDAAMRWDILHRRSLEGGAELAPPVLQAVASLPFDSIRDLVGAAHRLIAFQSVSDTPLDPAQARVLVTGELEDPPAEAARRPRAAPVEGASPAAATPDREDEFGSFLSDVVSSVSQQVDQWRARIADRILHHEAEGYHTARLQALLDQELPAQPEAILQRFERDLELLGRLEAEIRELAPDLAEHEAFRDPDQIAVAEQLVEQARTRDLVGWLPQEDLRLEDVVEGTSNRVAVEAVRGVAADPGAAANPLVLVGESGVGKSLLLHGLGNALVARGLSGVACLGARGFLEEVQGARDAEGLGEWRRRYRWAGALLVDDVHLLTGQLEAQEELAGLLDHLVGERRPVVVTSVVPVAELTGLTSRLLTRLASGVAAEIPRPDREVRLGVVRQLLAATEASGDAALADYLAGRPADSLRAVQGLVQRVLRAAEAAHAPPTRALARQVLEASGSHPGAAPAIRPRRVGPTVGGPRLREKLVDAWPHVRDRLIEELR